MSIRYANQKSSSVSSYSSILPSRNSTLTSNQREQVVSWVLHSLKIVLGYEDIRREIIRSMFPSVPHPEHIKTFDAHIAYTTKSSYIKHYEKKKNEILKYCRQCMELDKYVVFTATNLEEYRTKAQVRDTETHYQMFIIDNAYKTLWVIDPALKRNNQLGIYVPHLALEVVMPWFNEHGYKTGFIPLSNPAQTDDSEDNADIFCQSWTLYILLKVLKHPQSIAVKIPKGQTERYEILIEFYQRILTEVPSIGTLLQEEFVSELNSYKPDGYKTMLNVRALDVARTLTPSDMYSAND